MNRPSDLIRLARPHHWIKSGFVFVGLLFGHAWHDLDLTLHVTATAVGFSLVASAVYALNDFLDRERDQAHPTKRTRPVAAGRVTPAAALWLAGLLAPAGLLLGLWGSPTNCLLILLYATLNIAYSLRLKHVVILDVFVIAAGFMLRLLAGTVGVGIAPSKWLLLCGLMVTLFLGFTKRRAEHAPSSAQSSRAVLDFYSVALLDKMLSVTAAGTIITYSLYTMNPETIAKHGTENLIYTVPFVIYGVFRFMYLVHSDSGGEDTTHDVFHDPHLLAAVLAWIALTWLLVAF
jgi:4-hydroxybenzoate polyprenyltransferase